VIDPLTDFTHGGWDAPYFATSRDEVRRTRVVAVHPKTPYVAARRGDFVHLHAGVAAVFERNAARFGARFLCDGASNDVEVLANADAHGGLCVYCEDTAKGPCVYRCFNAVRLLIYIGSTEKYLRRIRRHESRTPWWPEVADIQVERCPTLFQARAAERLAIKAEKPLHNKIHNGYSRRSA
jgi:hypothetical protein